MDQSHLVLAVACPSTTFHIFLFWLPFSGHPQRYRPDWNDSNAGVPVSLAPACHARSREVAWQPETAGWRNPVWFGEHWYKDNRWYTAIRIAAI